MMKSVPHRTGRALRLIIALWRTVVSILVLTPMLMCAIWHDIMRRMRMEGGGAKACVRSFSRAHREPANIKSIEQLAAELGFITESHFAVTEDGYRLQLYRLRRGAKAPQGEHKDGTAGDGIAHGVKRSGAAVVAVGAASTVAGVESSVLLQHGLFQTCLPFVFNGGQGSLAFALANAGHDVWLGNNRGNLHSRHHNTYTVSDDEFWNFGVDEHALDVAAMVRYIKANNEGRSLTYIGHSQGCAQALIAFSWKPELQQLVSQFIALSPGAFVKTLESVPLRLLASLSNKHPRLFYFMFGHGAFLPFMEIMRHYLGVRIFGYLAFCMFNYLMRWGDDGWDKTRKFLYFSQTPGGTSARTVAQWMQQAASGRFFRYNYGSAKLNQKHYGCDHAPDVSLSELRLPVSVIYGGQDLLLDYPKLIANLPNCPYSLNVTHHSHMDNLNAMDAQRIVYPEVLRLLGTKFPHGTFPTPPTAVV